MGVSGARGAHTGQLGHPSKDPFQKMPGGGHIGCLSRQGQCVQISLNSKSHPEGRRVSPRQSGIWQNPRWGALLQPQKFSQPHTEGVLQEQFSSRLCLQPWVTGKVTHIPAPARGHSWPTPELHPQLSQLSGQWPLFFPPRGGAWRQEPCAQVPTLTRWPRGHGPCLLWSSVSPYKIDQRQRGLFRGVWKGLQGLEGAGELWLCSGSFSSYPRTGDRQEGAPCCTGLWSEACLVLKQDPWMPGW